MNKLIVRKAHARCGVLALALVVLGWHSPLSVRAGTQGQALPRASSAVYVAVGDSLTEGFGTANPATQSFPALLARYLPHGARVLNLGIGGIGLADAIDLELPDALAAHPTLVTVWLGSQDLSTHVPLGTFKTNLERLLNALSPTHARLFILTMPDPRAIPASATAAYTTFGVTEARAYNRAIAAAAARHGVILIDVFAVTKPVWAGCQDGIHPKAAGYAVLAQVVYRAMHRHGAL